MIDNPHLVRPSLIHGDAPKILFFGEAPGPDEVKVDQAFVGKAGQLLRRVLQQELPGRSLVLDNVCPEWLGDIRNKPMADKLNEYAEYRRERIRQVRPAVIVLLGERAMAAFKVKGRPVHRCGEVDEVGGIPAVISVHPSYCLHQPDQVRLYQRVFAAVRSCLAPKADDTQGVHLVAPWIIRSFLNNTREKLCCVDIETSCLKADDPSAIVLTAAIRCGKETIWFGLRHKDSWNSDTDSLEKDFREWWSCGPRIVHNAAHELAWLGDAPIVDTLLQAAILAEHKPKGLDYQVTNVLEKPSYWGHIDLKHTPEEDLSALGVYNANDAWHTWELHLHQRRLMTSAQKIICDEVLFPLRRLLMQMTVRGIAVDRKLLKKLTIRQKAVVTAFQEKVAKAFGINPRSPKQMREYLYETRRLPVTVLTRKGLPSAGDEAIAKLVAEHPELQLLQNSRLAESLLSRVFTPWLKHSEADGFLHSAFSLGHVVTWRLSSQDPNLQNVDRDGPQRKALVSRFPGGKIVQFDYSQHELRVFAAQTGCAAMLQAFREKRDVHQDTCDAFRKAGVRTDRKTSKNCNFGLLYGGGPQTLQQRYNIPLKEGYALVRAWDAIYPERQKFYADVEKSLLKHRYVENIFGLRRHLDRPHDPHERRQAYNFPIQSAAVLICYLAMLDVQSWLSDGPWESCIVLQIHDSIVMDCPKNEVKRVSERVSDIMRNVDYPRYTGKRLKNEIPLEVECKIGDHF